MMQRASMMGRQSQLCARQAMISARSSAAVRLMATSCGGKIEAPPMVYISGAQSRLKISDSKCQTWCSYCHKLLRHPLSSFSGGGLVLATAARFC